MNFAKFKEMVKSHTSPSPNDHQILTGYPTKFKEEDEIIRLKLHWGNCPVCFHRVTAELHHKQAGVTWYSCTNNSNHLWEVDYIMGTVTPYEDSV